MENQLKPARRARGLAIWGLSVISGVSPSLLTAIEKWGYVPTANTQQRIAEALGVQVEDIWIRAESQSKSSTQGRECSEPLATGQNETDE